MVQMLVKLKDKTTCMKEWTIVELQGDLECNSGSSIAGKMAGQLIFDSTDRPILIIGYHILYGRIVENNPPIAILGKNKFSTIDQTLVMESIGKTTEYSILAVVKRKIVFRTRPKPIVTME